MLIGLANPLIHELEVASELHWRTIGFLLDRMHEIGANANSVNSKRLAQTHSKTNIHWCRDMGMSWITLDTKRGNAAANNCQANELADIADASET